MEKPVPIRYSGFEPPLLALLVLAATPNPAVQDQIPLLSKLSSLTLNIAKGMGWKLELFDRVKMFWVLDPEGTEVMANCR
jgi:hypothetical protein